MAAEQQKSEKPCVLVVDDSRVVRKSIIKVIKSEFDVLEADNGAAGWTALAHNSRIEVVISDIQMPEMDGYSFICKVRATDDPGLRDMPIIVITSAEDEVTRERAYACGANDFILKPFNSGELLKCVRAQLADYKEATGEADMVDPQQQAANSNVVPVVIPNTNQGTLKDAVLHIDAGLKILGGLQTNKVAPHALTLVLRVMPLIKYCNTKFKLGMDKEIAIFQQKIAAVRSEIKKAQAGTAA